MDRRAYLVSELMKGDCLRDVRCEAADLLEADRRALAERDQLRERLAHSETLRLRDMDRLAAYERVVAAAREAWDTNAIWDFDEPLHDELGAALDALPAKPEAAEEPCATCGGSGQTDDEYGPCPDCTGEAVMDKPELKPCPFCGGEPSLRQADNHPAWWILGCGCAVSPEAQEEGRAETIEAWNARAPSPDLEELRQDKASRALLEEAREVLVSLLWDLERLAWPETATATANSERARGAFDRITAHLEGPDGK